MPRRPTNARIAALATTLVAGVLAAFALKPSPSNSVRQVQPQAAEVRTQVIRRTVHIVRHEKPRHRNGSAAAGGRGSAVVAAPVAVSAAPRTATSGSHASAATPVSSVAAPRTRTSGAATHPSAPTAATPVRTRTSGAGGRTPGSGTSGSGASTPVRTRTSGATGTGQSGTSGGGTLRTRTSGGHGGDDGGRDD